MKKVLELVGCPFVHRGIEAFITNLIKHFDKNDIGIDLAVMNRFDNKNSEEIFRDKGIKVTVFDTGYLNKMLNLRKFLKQNHYDVIHIHSGRIKDLAVLSLISKLSGAEKVIVHSHSHNVPSLHHYVAKFLSYFIFPFMVDKYCACSYLAGRCKFPFYEWKKMTVINNGIDTERFKINNEVRKEYRSKLGYADDDIVIGHVARFSKEKNHKFLLKVLKELRTESDKYKLLLIGEGEDFEAVKSFAEELGLSNFICFAGVVDNVEDYMQAMDVSVLPSFFEGLPISGVEAQACGLPFIVSSGVSQEVKLTDNVKFVPIDSVKKWVEAIEEYSALPKTDNISKIREAGYDIRTTAEIIRKIYTGD